MNGPLLVTRSRVLLLVWAVMLCVALKKSTASAVEPAEGPILELWTQHMETPDEHEGVIKACRDFTKARPNDPLLPVVRGLQAWHELRAGRRSAALEIMTADLAAPAGTVTEGARRMALGWLTRVDREKIAGELQAYYRKQVAYPKSLDQLTAEARQPVTDRFGKPWVYRLTGFGDLAGFSDQKYSLQSAFLGDTSEFKAAVQLPYAARIAATPVQVVAGPGNLPAVKFNVAGAAPVIAVGQAASDLYLAYVGTRIVVVSDYTHWRIFPRPR